MRIAPTVALTAALALSAAAAAQEPAPAPPPVAAPEAPAAAPPEAPPAPTAEDWRPLDPANTLVMDTTKGRIVIEMHPEIAPAHVARIKALTRSGYYNGARFYRVLPFMAQGGDKNRTFRSPLPYLKAEFFFTMGPAVKYAAFGPSPAGDAGFVGSMPVQLEQDGSGKASVFFCPGIASFPHGADPDTANSQIFLMKTRAINLEKTFTAWGRVVKGQEVVEAIKLGEPPPAPVDTMTVVRVMADMPAAARPAFMVMDTKGAAFTRMLQDAAKAKGPAFTLCDVPVPTK